MSNPNYLRSLQNPHGSLGLAGPTTPVGQVLRLAFTTGIKKLLGFYVSAKKKPTAKKGQQKSVNEKKKNCSKKEKRKRRMNN